MGESCGVGGWWCDELGIGIDMYTLMCIKWMTNENLLYKKINKIKFKDTTAKKGRLGVGGRDELGDWD